MAKKVKKHSNKGKMPIYIPNQPTNWMFMQDDQTIREQQKEFEFQKKLALKKR